MFKRLMVEEKGFTLVELLVTISILAVLFGVVTLTLGGVGADADTTVKAAEQGVVQSALDIAMADNGLGAGDVDVQSAVCLTGAETVTTGVPISDYLRTDTSVCQYSWDVNGDVTQGTCDC